MILVIIVAVDIYNRKYKVLMSVCVSVCVCVCLCDNSKNNGSVNLKLEHIVVYGNSSGEFCIGHCPIGQGHSVTLKFFSTYQIKKEVVITYAC